MEQGLPCSPNKLTIGTMGFQLVGILNVTPFLFLDFPGVSPAYKPHPGPLATASSRMQIVLRKRLAQAEHVKTDKTLMVSLVEPLHWIPDGTPQFIGGEPGQDPRCPHSRLHCSLLFSVVVHPLQQLHLFLTFWSDTSICVHHIFLYRALIAQLIS